MERDAGDSDLREEQDRHLMAHLNALRDVQAVCVANLVLFNRIAKKLFSE